MPSMWTRAMTPLPMKPMRTRSATPIREPLWLPAEDTDARPLGRVSRNRAHAVRLARRRTTYAEALTTQPGSGSPNFETR